MAQFIPVAIGAAVAAFATIALAPTIKTQGSRTDTRLQTSTYGADLKEIFGEAYRIAGNLIWLEGDQINEIVTTDTQGGKGGPKVKTTTYSYTATCLIALANKEARGIRRIWADSVLIYDVRPDASQEELIVSGDNIVETIEILLGGDSQEPLDVIIADKGSSPAYREISSVLFKNFDLTEFGNRIPNITVELLPKNDAVPVTDAGLVRIDLEAATATTNSGWSFRYDPQTLTFQRGGGAFGSGATAIQFCDNYNLDGTFISGTSLPGQLRETGRDINAVYDPTSYTPWGGEMAQNEPRVTYPVSFGFVGGAGEPPNIVPWQRRDSSKPLAPSFVSLFEYFSPGDGHPIQYSIFAIGVNNGQTYAVSQSVTTGIRLRRFNEFGFGVGANIESAQAFASANSDLKIDEYAHGGLGNIYVWQRDGGGVLYNFDDDCNVIQSWSLPAGSGFSGMCIVNNIIFGNDNANNRWIISRINLDGTFTNLLITSNGSSLGGEPNPVFPLNNAIATGGSVYIFNNLYDDASVLDTPTLDVVITNIMLNNPQVTPADFDVSDPALAAIVVQGYVVESTARTSEKLQDVMATYNVYIVESDYTLVFKVRTGTPVRVLTENDLVPNNVNGSDEWFQIVEDNDNKNSRRMTVGYSDLDRNYDQSVQSTFRVQTSTKNETRIDFPIVLDDQEAADLSARFISEEDIQSTKTRPFRLSYKHSDLEPGDVVTVQYQNENLDVELAEVIYDAEVGEVELEGRLVSSDAINSTGTSSPPHKPINDTIAIFNTLSNQYIMDLPPLQDTDKDFLGFYFAGHGFSVSWPSAVLFQSLSGGESFAEVLTTVTPSPVGTIQLANVLNDTLDHNLIDYTSTLDVILDTPGAVLSSITDIDFFNGVNAAFVTDAGGTVGELIYFQNAVLQGDGVTWRLTTFLRGLRGTEDQIVNAAGFERFIVLASGFTQGSAVSQTALNTELTYRFVTQGAAIQDALDNDVTITGLSQTCYAPGGVRSYREVTDNIVITWDRRPRVLFEWNDLTDVAQVEPQLLFDVEIMNGSTVVRTISSLPTNTYIYGSADQITDFGSVQSAVDIRLYQISDITGRGKVKEATV